MTARPRAARAFFESADVDGSTCRARARTCGGRTRGGAAHQCGPAAARADVHVGVVGPHHASGLNAGAVQTTVPKLWRGPSGYRSSVIHRGRTTGELGMLGRFVNFARLQVLTWAGAR